MTDATKMAIEALGGLIESVTGVDQVSLPHESGKTEGGAMKERRCCAAAGRPRATCYVETLGVPNEMAGQTQAHQGRGLHQGWSAAR